MNKKLIIIAGMIGLAGFAGMFGFAWLTKPSTESSSIEPVQPAVTKEEPSKEISPLPSGDSPPPITTAEPELEGDEALDAAFGPCPEREPIGVTGNWADPAAGGADPPTATLADKICRFNGLSGFEALPEGKRETWARHLSELLRQWGGASVEEVKLAWAAWVEEYAWHGKANPFYSSFGDEFGPLLVQVREEGQRVGKPKVVSWRDDERWQDVGDGPMVVRAER